MKTSGASRGKTISIIAVDLEASRNYSWKDVWTWVWHMDKTISSNVSPGWMVHFLGSGFLTKGALNVFISIVFRAVEGMDGKSDHEGHYYLSLPWSRDYKRVFTAHHADGCGFSSMNGSSCGVPRILEKASTLTFYFLPGAIDPLGTNPEEKVRPGTRKTEKKITGYSHR
jgi:hypothetical protein